MDQQAIALSKAIIQHESGGDFAIRGKSQEYGGAQWTEPTWNAHAKDVLGYVPKFGSPEMTKDVQKAVLYSVIKKDKDSGLNPAQIAAKWNSGSSTGWEDKVGVNRFGVQYDVPKYVKSVTDYYQQYKQDQPMEGQAGQTVGPVAEQPSGEYTGALGTKPGDSFMGKLLDNSITRGIQNIFPGKRVGEAIGTLGGYVASPNKEQYDLSAPTPLQVAGDIAQGALTIASPVAGKGAGIGTRLGVQALAGAGYGLSGGLATGETDNLNLLGDAARGSASGLAAAGAGELIGAGISRLAKPFASKATGEAVSVASRLGIGESELPLSSMTNSKTVRYMESLFGGENLASQAESVSQKLVSLADDLKAKTGIAEDLSLAGKNIAEGMKKFESTYKGETSRLYDLFSEKGGSLPAKPFSSVDVIHNVIDSKAAIGEAKDAQYFKDKLAVLTGGETKNGDFALPTFDTLKKVRTAVGEKISTRFQDPFVNQNIGQLKQLYGALSDDMNRTVASTGNAKLVAALDKANEAYKQGKVLFDTEYARTIRRMSANGQFDKIIPAIVSPTKSVSNIQNMLKVIGEENVPRLQSALLEDIFSKAKGTGESFTELGIGKTIAKYGDDRLRQILTPEQFAVIKDIDSVARIIGKAQKISKGSQTAFLEKTFAKMYFSTSVIKGLLTGNLLAAISGMAPIIGEKATEKFIASEIGRKILTTGLSMPNLGETVAKAGALTGMTANRVSGSDDHISTR
jgi:hypothetical protein